MRYDVQKYLFVGSEERRKDFFRTAQKSGIVQFISQEAKRIKRAPEPVLRVLSAIKIVRSLPVPDAQEFPSGSGGPSAIVDAILEVDERISSLEERKRQLVLEEERVKIFGQFSLGDVAAIRQETGYFLQYFCGKKGLAEECEEESLLHIGADHGLDYFVSVSPEKRQYPGLAEMKIEQPVGELRREKEELEGQLHLLEQQRKGYAKYNSYLHEVLKATINETNLEGADRLSTSAIQNQLFSVEGFVPENKLEELEALCSEEDVFAEQVLIEEQERVPTYLENHGAGHIGEDLVEIYDTPGPEDRDPSMWVLVFFSLFFSIIVGDAGYGLAFCLASLYLYGKFPQAKGVGRRFLRLTVILGVTCVLWGFLSTSFFGIKISPKSPLQHLSLVHWMAEKKADYHLSQKDAVWEDLHAEFPQIAELKSGRDILNTAVKHLESGPVYTVHERFFDQILLELALVIGIIHLSLSCLRYLDRNWSSFGWVLFMVGGFLYFPEYLGAYTFVNYLLGVSVETAALLGLELLVAGFGSAILLALFQHRWLGLAEIPNVIQVFADVLSYLRLYALGLASGIVSATVNQMASAVPMIFGGLILLFGHTINLILAIAGGVIHGLRLNFLEWYHYSFDGGGKKFSPLAELEVSDGAVKGYKLHQGEQ